MSDPWDNEDLFAEFNKQRRKKSSRFDWMKLTPIEYMVIAAIILIVLAVIVPSVMTEVPEGHTNNPHQNITADTTRTPPGLVKFECENGLIFYLNQTVGHVNIQKICSAGDRH